MNKPDTTAAHLLEEVGRALFDSVDWKSRLAQALDVRRDTIQFWLNGKMPLSVHHPMFGRLLELVERRAAEMTAARDNLRAAINHPREP